MSGRWSSTMSVQIPWYSLIPPAAVGDEIPRDRVSAALDAAVAAGPLTVVCAPSGFGKSVAVSAWCRSRDDAGWVTLPPKSCGSRFSVDCPRSTGC